jgi:hypothetical protein
MKHILYNSALSLAYNSNNISSTDILLNYLKFSEVRVIYRMIDIFPKLMKFDNFQGYLDNFVTQTLQMKKKLVLKVKKPLNDNIVAITSTSSCFIDDTFYED